jgi:hypothetical protein
MDVKTGFAAFSLSLLAAATASAQPAPGSKDVIPEKQAPSTIQDGRSESLSSKLHQSNGVIAPTTDVDPGMKTPAPVAHPNSTPVIPPSATGGENAK